MFGEEAVEFTLGCAEFMMSFRQPGREGWDIGVHPWS